MKKKTLFGFIALAVIACVVVTCVLIDHAAEREFPIDGDNVADIDPNRVVEMIAEAKRLDDGSQLCVNEDNFDLMFTSDFKWANDGAIRFFYTKNHKIYSAQLRMFHDDNTYFMCSSMTHRQSCFE